MGMLYIVGVGPGDPGLITLKGLRIIERSATVAGWESVLNRFSKYLVGKYVIKLTYKNESNALHELMRRATSEEASLLMHGDPLVSEDQLMNKVISLCREFGIRYEVVPGVSSINAALALLNIDLSSTFFVTLHVRGDLSPRINEIVNLLNNFNRYLVVLPPPYPNGPQKLASELINKVLCDPMVTIIERVTYDDQSITQARLSELMALNKTFSDLTIIVINPCVSDSRVY